MDSWLDKMSPEKWVREEGQTKAEVDGPLKLKFGLDASQRAVVRELIGWIVEPCCCFLEKRIKQTCSVGTRFSNSI